MDAMLQHGKENNMCEIEFGDISSGIISQIVHFVGQEL